MGLGKQIIQGMIGSFLMEGIEVNKLDLDKQILFITLPERSYSYEKGGIIKCAADYARRIKETWIEMGIFNQDCMVKYKTKDIYWTKEMGDINYNNNVDKVLNLIFPN